MNHEAQRDFFQSVITLTNSDTHHSTVQVDKAQSPKKKKPQNRPIFPHASLCQC